MRKSAAAVLMFAWGGCATSPTLDQRSASIAIKVWHQEEFEPESLAAVRVYPVRGRPDLRVAICDFQEDWWGFFGVYCIQDGKVLWKAKGGGDPVEQSILSVRGLQLPGFQGPIVEVYGRTHMGNGSLYLYELRGQGLHLLLETRAVDCHADRYTFRHGRLDALYNDLDGDGIADLTLCGWIEDRGEDGETVLSSARCNKAFLWDRSQGKFVEDPARRRGFENYPD